MILVKQKTNFTLLLCIIELLQIGYNSQCVLLVSQLLHYDYNIEKYDLLVYFSLSLSLQFTIIRSKLILIFTFHRKLTMNSIIIIYNNEIETKVGVYLL